MHLGDALVDLERAAPHDTLSHVLVLGEELGDGDVGGRAGRSTIAPTGKDVRKLFRYLLAGVPSKDTQGANPGCLAEMLGHKVVLKPLPPRIEEVLTRQAFHKRTQNTRALINLNLRYRLIV